MWTPERGCIGKRAYFDKAEAKQFARAVSERNVRKGDNPAHVYKCPGCALYHVGHPIGSRSEAA